MDCPSYVEVSKPTPFLWEVKSSQVKSIPLPTTTAGLRSTFDRLPYGCLLFMYRLDLTLLELTLLGKLADWSGHRVSHPLLLHLQHSRVLPWRVSFNKSVPLKA